MKTLELAKLIIHTLDDNKAIDITELDVTKLTDVTDRLIICSALSSRHAAAMADKLIDVVKNKGVRPSHVEGETEGEWVLIDLQDIVVHIMLPETRDFYSLEKLWTMTESARKSNIS